MTLGSSNSGNINRIWQYAYVWKVIYHRVIKKKCCDTCLFSQKLLRLENKEEIRYILKFLIQKREECDSNC